MPRPVLSLDVLCVRSFFAPHIVQRSRRVGRHLSEAIVILVRPVVQRIRKQTRLPSAWLPHHTTKHAQVRTIYVQICAERPVHAYRDDSMARTAHAHTSWYMSWVRAQRTIVNTCPSSACGRVHAAAVGQVCASRYSNFVGCQASAPKRMVGSWAGGIHRQRCNDERAPAVGV